MPRSRSLSGRESLALRDDEIAWPCSSPSQLEEYLVDSEEATSLHRRSSHVAELVHEHPVEFMSCPKSSGHDNIIEASARSDAMMLLSP